MRRVPVLGTEVAVILIEQSTKKFKVRFRSRNPAVNCSAGWRSNSAGEVIELPQVPPSMGHSEEAQKR